MQGFLRRKEAPRVVLMMVVGVVITVVVWSNFGPVWGLVAGFFLVGGFGWKLLYAVVGTALPGRKDKMEFVGAWEARAGEMRFGIGATYPPPGAYQRWQQDRRTTGESAAAWLDRVMGPSAGAPEYGYQGQATDPSGRTVYPWQGEEFTSLRDELRGAKEPGGGLAWQELGKGGTGYFESLAFVLNKHLGWDKSLGRRYLQDLADGVPKNESIRSNVNFLMTEGR